jgi:hypothetical protein
MHDLNYALAQLCKRNHDGSFTTQANRKAILNQIGNQLHDMGYRHLHAGNLKPKHINLAKVTDPSVRLSLRLQTEFGLRRAESLKIRPAWADRGDRLVLKDSWTKGSRPREIPIRTEAQRVLLDKARRSLGVGA